MYKKLVSYGSSVINIFVLLDSYVGVCIAEGSPKRHDGKMEASTEPGLGITPKLDVLGDPVLSL